MAINEDQCVTCEYVEECEGDLRDCDLFFFEDDYSGLNPNYHSSQFRDPGGRSALRAGNPVHPCPTCGRENMLTDADKRLGYQCDFCADALEGIGHEY